jgi:hypothetical protein
VYTTSANLGVKSLLMIFVLGNPNYV